jgi:signal transduction histidine kinase
VPKAKVRFNPIRRGPTVPEPAPLALAMATVVIAAMQNMFATVPVGRGPFGWTAAAVWGVGSTVAYAIPLLGIPLWRGLRRRWPDLALPRLRNWLAFHGTFSLLSLAGGVQRSLLAEALAPALLDGKSAVALAINVAGSTVVPVAFLELMTAYQVRRADLLLERHRLAEELRTSRNAVVAADDRLRKELALILHGQVQSHLVAAWALIAQARASAREPAAALPRLAEAQRFLAVVREEALATVEDLLLPAHAGLLAPIQEVVERYRAVLGVTWRVADGLADDEPAVAHQASLMAARLVDEALLNALRYAAPTMVTVTVRRAAGQAVQVCIEDDGRGFDARAVGQGLGTSALGREMQELGGAWELWSEPGRGTRVTFEVPALAPQGVPA